MAKKTPIEEERLPQVAKPSKNLKAPKAGKTSAQAPNWTSSQRDTLHRVELPEGTAIHVRVAGPMVRFLAALLDILIMTGINIVLVIFTTFVIGRLFGTNVAQGTNLILSFLLTWFYFVFFEAGKRGASPGKRRYGLRVVQPSGAPITLGQAMTRNMLRFVDFLPLGYGVGLITCLSNRTFQRLGDLAANTLVVYDTHRLEYINRLTDIDPMPPPVPLSREEQLSLLAFADRRKAWSEERAEELANHLEDLTGKRDAEASEDVVRIAAWIQRSSA